MQIEDGKEDTIEGRDPANVDETESEEEEEEDAPSLEEDSVNETSPARRNTENVEQEQQDKVVGYTSVVGSED